ncbi:MAG TPA: YaiO family outer membrane beta-barrel protein, partial [bacterium]|nr:YaiO family outer membrane beta-barrel protein [bacterium]
SLYPRAPDETVTCDVLLGRGRVYAWEERWAEAERDLTTASLQSPAYADVWSALADMYLWSGRPAEAAGAAGRLIALTPSAPAGFVARGKACRAAGMTEAARADFAAAGARGLAVEEVTALLASLDVRRANPAATVPAGFAWSVNAEYGVTRFRPERAEWRESSVTVRRHFSRGSLAVEYLDANRFSLADRALAVDAYADLWPRAYVNLRYQHCDDGQLYANHAYRAELFQGVGSGWELSGSYDHMDWGTTNTDMYGAGLGRYFGDWYLRERTMFIPATAGMGYAHSLLARYYYSGNADDYAEISGGFGHGRQYRSDGTRERTQSSSAGLVVQKYLTDHFGVKLGAGYDDDRHAFVDYTLSIGLLTRW